MKRPRLAPLDLVSALANDELLRRDDRLPERLTKQARFRDPDRTLDRSDFDFNAKMNPALIYELASGGFIQQREDAGFLSPPDCVWARRRRPASDSGG